VPGAHSVRGKLNSTSARPIGRASDPVREIRAVYGLDSLLLRDFSLVAPQCSLSFGAAGIAYSLSRAADLLHDPQLLLAADAWIAAAEHHASGKHAFFPAAPRVRRRATGASIVFAEPGLIYAKTIVRWQKRDSAGADAAGRQFLEIARRRLSRVADLHVGGLGLAVAAKQLTSCVSSVGLRGELSNFSRRVVRRAWAKTGTEIRRNRMLGFAHGVAGQVFATYMCASAKSALPVVQRLREVAIPEGKALTWPVRAGSGNCWAGWCNGLAGHLLMWTKVWQHSQDPGDREILDRLALGVWKYRMPLGGLCCGAAGQAVILASLSSAVADDHWRKKTLAWLGSFRPRWSRNCYPQSLFQGKLGLLLARLECEYAAQPQFPVYQHDPQARPLKN
jgi:eukaryotic-like serine/threonine-protein kinase